MKLAQRAPWFRGLAVAALTVTIAFLVIPMVALFAQTSPKDLLASLDDPQATDALWLSLRTSLIAIAVIVAIGTPAAYLLATRSFRARPLLLTVIELPLVLPPAAAGIALLAAFGPNGLLGSAIEDAGIRLVLETAGVVVALMFVSAPFYLRGAVAAFESVDDDILAASRTLGAGEGRTFLRVAVPVASAGLGAGLALAWGRALGEFGATLMFAGSLQGVTQTAPLAIFQFVGTDFTASLALSAVLLVVSAVLLLSVKLLIRPRDADA